MMLDHHHHHHPYTVTLPYKITHIINNLKMLKNNCYLDLEFRSALNSQLKTGCLIL